MMLFLRNTAALVIFSWHGYVNKTTKPQASGLKARQLRSSTLRLPVAGICLP